MEIVLKKGRRGGVLVVVKFTEDKNFNPVRLEWVPRLKELEEIDKVVRIRV